MYDQMIIIKHIHAKVFLFNKKCKTPYIVFFSFFKTLGYMFYDVVQLSNNVNEQFVNPLEMCKQFFDVWSVDCGIYLYFLPFEVYMIL